MKPFSSRQKKLIREQNIQLVAFVGITFLMFLMLIKVESLLPSFLLAFVISYLFSPIVNFLERNEFKRQISISLLFIITGGLLALLTSIISPLISQQLNLLQLDSPRYIEGTMRIIKNIESRFIFLTDIIGTYDIGEQVEVFLRNNMGSFFESLPQIVSKSLTTLILAPFFAFFMLRDGNKMSRKMLSLVPNRNFELILNLFHQINQQLGGFIRARLLEAAIVGAVVWFGLWLISFPYAPLLAVFAALTNLIPYVGPLIGAVPAIIIALINSTPSIDFVLMLATYGLAQIIDIFFIIPMVVARIVDLHPITVVVAIIIGSQFMGVLGMIIAIPVASALKVTIISVYDHLVEFKS